MAAGERPVLLSTGDDNLISCLFWGEEKKKSGAQGAAPPDGAEFSLLTNSGLPLPSPHSEKREYSDKVARAGISYCIQARLAKTLPASLGTG